MKIQILKKRIIKNFSIAGVLAVIFGSTFYLYYSEKTGVASKIAEISEETSKFNIELVDLQSKTAEIKKYKDLWPSISENKKNTNGIKIDEINEKLIAIATKYGISSPTIKLSLPDVIKGGVFDRKTVSVMMTVASVNFIAVNDVKATMFANEFLTSLKGYPVVTSFSISKSRDYTRQELLDVSTGKSPGVVNSKIDFFWYVYKDLEKKPDETKSPNAETKMEGSNVQKPAN